MLCGKAGFVKVKGLQWLMEDDEVWGSLFLFSYLQVLSMAPTWESREDLNWRIPCYCLITSAWWANIYWISYHSCLCSLYTRRVGRGLKKACGESQSAMDYLWCLGSIGEVHFLSSEACHGCTWPPVIGSNRVSMKCELYSRQSFSLTRHMENRQCYFSWVVRWYFWSNKSIPGEQKKV